MARGKTWKGLKTRQDHRWKMALRWKQSRKPELGSIDCIQWGLTRTKSKQAANLRPQQRSHFSLELFAKTREQATAF